MGRPKRKAAEIAELLIHREQAAQSTYTSTSIPNFGNQQFEQSVAQQEAEEPFVGQALLDALDEVNDNNRSDLQPPLPKKIKLRKPRVRKNRKLMGLESNDEVVRRGRLPRDQKKLQREPEKPLSILHDNYHGILTALQGETGMGEEQMAEAEPKTTKLSRGARKRLKRRQHEAGSTLQNPTMPEPRSSVGGSSVVETNGLLQPLLELQIASRGDVHQGTQIDAFQPPTQGSMIQYGKLVVKATEHREDDQNQPVINLPFRPSSHQNHQNQTCFQNSLEAVPSKAPPVAPYDNHMEYQPPFHAIDMSVVAPNTTYHGLGHGLWPLPKIAPFANTYVQPQGMPIMSGNSVQPQHGLNPNAPVSVKPMVLSPQWSTESVSRFNASWTDLTYLAALRPSVVPQKSPSVLSALKMSVTSADQLERLTSNPRRIAAAPNHHQYHTRSKNNSIAPQSPLRELHFGNLKQVGQRTQEFSTPPSSYMPLNTSNTTGPIKPSLIRRSQSSSPHTIPPIPESRYIITASFPPTRLDSAQPLLIISDLNGTLIYRATSRSSGHVRPGLDGFLKYLYATHTVMIWTSAQPENCKNICDKMLDKAQKRLTVAMWARDKLGLTQKQYRGKVQVYKRLETVWADDKIQKSHPHHKDGGRWGQHNTLLIDDSIMKASGQPFNLVNIPELTRETLLEEESMAETENRYLQATPVDHLSQQPPLGVQSHAVLRQVAGYLEEAKWWADVTSFVRYRPFKMNDGWDMKGMKEVPNVDFGEMPRVEG